MLEKNGAPSKTKSAEVTFCFNATFRPRCCCCCVMKLLRHCCIWHPHSSITSMLSMSYRPQRCKRKPILSAMPLAFSLPKHVKCFAWGKKLLLLRFRSRLQGGEGWNGEISRGASMLKGYALVEKQSVEYTSVANPVLGQARSESLVVINKSYHHFITTIIICKYFN